MSVQIFYVVTSPENITKRFGQIVTLRLKQDNNGAYLDSVFNDCIQIYPRPGQPEDSEKVVVKARFGTKMQSYLADQCGTDNPFYDPESVQMLDVYDQFFGSLEKVKEDYHDLWDLISVEYADEDGNIQTKQVTKIDLEHKWAGDEP